MKIPFKITVERVVIVVLLTILVYKSCTRAAMDCPQVSETTVIEHKTTTAVDSSSNTEIKEQQPQKLQIIESPGKIERVKDPAKLSAASRRKVKQVNRYLDTTQLDGAIIFSEILAEGRILEHNTRTEIEHQETTITKTVVERPGGLFVSPGLEYSPVGGLEAVESSLTYFKGGWGASAGIYYNFRQVPRVNLPGSLGFKLKIHIKL